MKTLSILLIVGLLMVSGCLRHRRSVKTNKQTLKGSGVVYLLPLGNFPSATIEKLTAYYKSRYGIDVQSQSKIDLVAQVRNEKRKQLIAEATVSLYYHLPQSDDPHSVLYGRVDSFRDLDQMGEEF